MTARRTGLETTVFKLRFGKMTHPASQCMMCVVHRQTPCIGADGMQLVTILNRVCINTSHSSTATSTGSINDKHGLLIRIVPRKNSRPVCSELSSVRDRFTIIKRNERRFRVHPVVESGNLLRIPHAASQLPISVASPSKQVPWGDGKHRTTILYRWFLAKWAERLSWKETAVKLFARRGKLCFAASNMRWNVGNRQ